MITSTCFGPNDLFPLVSVREGLVSAGFWWEGLVSAGFGSFQVVSAGFGSFRFLVITCSVVGLGSLEVTLHLFLVHCILCYLGGFYSACWERVMEDETLFHYIFLFLLLLIPFLVIGLRIKAFAKLAILGVQNYNKT